MTDPLREEREQAAALSQWLAKQGKAPNLSKAHLIELGKRLWRASYQHTKDDAEAFELLAQALKADARMRPNNGPAVATAANFLYLPSEQIAYFGAARWVDQGLPIVQMGHKYAAALMSTSVEAGQVEHVVPPWKAFLIEVPNGLLSIDNPDTGKSRGISHILVQRVLHASIGLTWSFIALTDTSLSFWQHGAKTEDLLDEAIAGEIKWEEYSFGFDTDDRDERVNLLIGRLIVGVCLAMSDKDNRPVKKIGKSHRYKGDIRNSTEPMTRIFQLGRPIKLDCREALSDYLEGRSGKKVNVQTLVRGHWKRQAHGPGMSLRKWIHIEPYWRGPEDAPILQRPHKIES